MRRIGAEGTTMPDGTAARRGRGSAQDADRHVACRIRERRLALGLTQQQVAELVGVTYQQAHKYEVGGNRVSAGRLYQIARALGVEPAYFFEGAGDGTAGRDAGAADARAGARLHGPAEPPAPGGGRRAGPRSRRALRRGHGITG
jgi:DNA-binding XRE family transcriptional regulator